MIKPGRSLNRRPAPLPLATAADFVPVLSYSERLAEGFDHSTARTSCAIICSSSVGITRTATRPASVDIKAACRSLRSASRASPKNSSPWQIRARTGEVLLRHSEAAAFDQNRHVVGLELQRPIKVVHGLRTITLVPVREAALAVDRRIRRIELDGAIEVRDPLGDLSASDERSAAPLVARCSGGLSRCRLRSRGGCGVRRRRRR